MTPRLDRATFALALIGLGILTLVFGDFALQWQPVPAWMPARTVLAYLSGAVMLSTGFGLLLVRTEVVASRVLVVYLGLWFLLKVPALFTGRLLGWNGWVGGRLRVSLTGVWVLLRWSGGIGGCVWWTMLGY